MAAAPCELLLVAEPDVLSMRRNHVGRKTQNRARANGPVRAAGPA